MLVFSERIRYVVQIHVITADDQLQHMHTLDQDFEDKVDAENFISEFYDRYIPVNPDQLSQQRPQLRIIEQKSVVGDVVSSKKV